MNLTDKLQRLEHADSCGADIAGPVSCTCGLSEVRAAVLELITVADAFYVGVHNYQWLGRALRPFTDAEDAP
jgi:hypothetical protein